MRVPRLPSLFPSAPLFRSVSTSAFTLAGSPLLRAATTSCARRSAGVSGTGRTSVYLGGGGGAADCACAITGTPRASSPRARNLWANVISERCIDTPLPIPRRPFNGWRAVRVPPDDPSAAAHRGVRGEGRKKVPPLPGSGVYSTLLQADKALAGLGVGSRPAAPRSARVAPTEGGHEPVPGADGPGVHPGGSRGCGHAAPRARGHPLPRLTVGDQVPERVVHPGW